MDEKIALTIFGTVLIALNGLVSSLFCEEHPKALTVFCIIGALLGCSFVFIW